MDKDKIQNERDEAAKYSQEEWDKMVDQEDEGEHEWDSDNDDAEWAWASSDFPSDEPEDEPETEEYIEDQDDKDDEAIRWPGNDDDVEEEVEI